MRVDRLAHLNISNIDFESRKCVVLGTENKERPVCFDTHTKFHLKNCLASWNDQNQAFFVMLDKPHASLKISGEKIHLRCFGKMRGF